MLGGSQGLLLLSLIIHLAPIDTPFYPLSPNAADLGADHLVLTLTLSPYQINMVPLVL